MTESSPRIRSPEAKAESRTGGGARGAPPRAAYREQAPKGFLSARAPFGLALAGASTVGLGADRTRPGLGGKARHG